MEPVRLWAAVEFTARSGSTEALLTAAARAGLHLYGVTALPSPPDRLRGRLPSCER